MAQRVSETLDNALGDAVKARAVAEGQLASAVRDAQRALDLAGNASEWDPRAFASAAVAVLEAAADYKAGEAMCGVLRKLRRELA